jgi:hypothetical protein
MGVELSCLEGDASVCSVLEISGGLPQEGTHSLRIDRKLVLTNRKNDYRRSIEKTQTGYRQAFIMPARDFRGSLKVNTGISKEDLSRLRWVHPASPGSILSISGNGHRRRDLLA